MSKLLAVFGATGQQGISVIENLRSDPELSKQFKIRAITRDVNSAKAKALLADNIEVVYGDALEPASLDTALSGVHTVFSMTVPHFTADKPSEEVVAKTIADAAVKQGAQYIIFSTLPGVTDISGGKYTHVFPFDDKARAEKYIRGLPIKGSFLSLGYFMENYIAQAFMAPVKQADGSLALVRHTNTTWPLVAAVEDTGKFVNAILADPDKYAGKTVCAAEKVYTTEEVAAIMSKVLGKHVGVKHISADEFRSIAPFGADAFDDMFRFGEEFMYYGPGTVEEVAWAAENARGKLMTLEEFLVAHPLKLEE